MERHRYETRITTFDIDARYEFVKELGHGVSGFVISAKHVETGEARAIKKISNIGTRMALAKSCLREIKMLRHFHGHDNITCLHYMDIIFQPEGDFNEVYLYEDLMESDLNSVIRSGQPLSNDHFKSFVYQTLCGLKFIHSANVIHRDLKPANLLVNVDCELKICDFGFARGLTTDGKLANGRFLTEYIAMRWYRAPEIILSYANYTSPIDLWSLGCILAELLGRKPIFQGRSYVDQLNQILHYLGKPSEETLQRFASSRAGEYIRSLPSSPSRSFATVFPEADPDAIDLLTKLLTFDPSKRFTCEEALQHPYLAAWRDPDNEPICPNVVEVSYETEESIDGIKRLIAEEVRTYRELVQSQMAKTTVDQAEPPDDPTELSHTSDNILFEQTRALIDKGNLETPTDISRPSSPVVEENPADLSQDLVISGFGPSAITILKRTLEKLRHLDLNGRIIYDTTVMKAHGGYCDVFIGRIKTDDSGEVKVAIKRLRLHIASSDTSFAKHLARELTVWSKANHRYVLPLLGFTLENDDYPILVSPWIENGTVAKYLKAHPGADLLLILQGIAEGLQHLHSVGIVHSDLKADNVLISNDGLPLICDFGVSRVVSTTQTVIETSTQYGGPKGTIRWMAIELLNIDETETPNVHTVESDIWALGMTYYELLTGEVPYSHLRLDMQVMYAILGGKLPQRPVASKDWPPQYQEVWTLCESCWKSHPKDRIRLDTLAAELTSLSTSSR